MGMSTQKKMVLQKMKQCNSSWKTYIKYTKYEVVNKLICYNILNLKVKLLAYI